MSFSQTTNPALKAIGEVVLSDELILATTPAATALFEREMAQCVSRATDAAFVQILVSGAGSSHASTGTDTASFLADLKTAMLAIQTDVNSRIYLVLPVNTFKAVSLLSGTGGLLLTNQTPSSGKYGAVTIIASSGATTTGVLFDASAVGADTDIVQTMVTRQATVEMADNPTSSDYHLVSLFQNDLTLFRCERYFGATILRPNSLATITGYS
jgi:HK97 family phage major capsid protein